MKKIFVLNGPNLNFLGKRPANIYGNMSYDTLCEYIITNARKYLFDINMFQSNHEGEAIDFIQDNFDSEGAIVNPGAWCHYNYALRDALIDFGKPVIETHISNIYGRERFRQRSVISGITEGVITGFGQNSYILALAAMSEILNDGRK